MKTQSQGLPYVLRGVTHVIFDPRYTRSKFDQNPRSNKSKHAYGIRKGDNQEKKKTCYPRSL
jgi:hypothetical protein